MEPTEPPQIKVRVAKDLKEKAEAAFRRQGVTMSEGVTRLLRTFLANEELQPLLLDQVRGLSRRDLARAILRRLGK